MTDFNRNELISIELTRGQWHLLKVLISAQQSGEPAEVVDEEARVLAHAFATILEAVGTSGPDGSAQ